MKILHLSSYDVFGGAALAAHRLHKGLREAGVESTMLVRRKYGSDPHVHGPGGILAGIASRLRRRRENWIAHRAGWTGGPRFTPGLTGGNLRRLVKRIAPDVIHLHWIGDGFLDIAELPDFARPIVWTLHDAWPFTGGCHYTGECRQFEDACGGCPLLDSESKEDLSHKLLERKLTAYDQCGIVPVAPSRWLAAQAGASRLLRGRQVRNIPYGLDLECFTPHLRAGARNRLGINEGQRLVLAGATGYRTDPRKGFDLFCETASRLSRIGRHEFIFAIFGGTESGRFVVDGVEIRELGSLKAGGEIAALFAAADVFVASSRQDNLPNTVCESLACGTPVAGFSIGGIPDMIEDSLNGCLVPAFDVGQLAMKMDQLFADAHRIPEKRGAARKTAERLFAMENCVKAYRNLYSEIGSLV